MSLSTNIHIYREGWLVSSTCDGPTDRQAFDYKARNGQGTCITLTPYYPLGTLRDALYQNLPFKRVRNWFPDPDWDHTRVAMRISFQTTLAMDLFHAEGCVHGDLKPSKVLIDGQSSMNGDWTIKVGAICE